MNRTMDETSVWITWWKQLAPLKRRSASTRLHGVISIKLSPSYSPPWEPKVSHYSTALQYENYNYAKNGGYIFQTQTMTCQVRNCVHNTTKCVE
jgi:hypothetical protein